MCVPSRTNALRCRTSLGSTERPILVWRDTAKLAFPWKLSPILHVRYSRLIGEQCLLMVASAVEILATRHTTGTSSLAGGPVKKALLTECETRAQELCFL